MEEGPARLRVKLRALGPGGERHVGREKERESERERERERHKERERDRETDWGRERDRGREAPPGEKRKGRPVKKKHHRMLQVSRRGRASNPLFVHSWHARTTVWARCRPPPGVLEISRASAC